MIYIIHTDIDLNKIDDHTIKLFNFINQSCKNDILILYLNLFEATNKKKIFENIQYPYMLYWIECFDFNDVLIKLNNVYCQFKKLNLSHKFFIKNDLLNPQDKLKLKLELKSEIKLESKYHQNIDFIYLCFDKKLNQNILEIIKKFEFYYNQNNFICLKIITNQTVANQIMSEQIQMELKKNNIEILTNLPKKELNQKIIDSDIAIDLNLPNKLIKFDELNLFDQLVKLNKFADLDRLDLIFPPITIVIMAFKIGFHYNILESWNNLTHLTKNANSQLIILISNEKLSLNKYVEFFTDNNINSTIINYNYSISFDDNITYVIGLASNEIIYLIDETNIYIQGLIENTYYYVKKNNIGYLSSSDIFVYCPKSEKYYIKNDKFNYEYERKSLLVINKKIIKKFDMKKALEGITIDLSKFYIQISLDNDLVNTPLTDEKIINLIDKYTIYELEYASMLNEKMIENELKKIKQTNIQTLKFPKLQVIGIFDEFLYHSYKDIFDITLCDLNFKIKKQYDFFFCESCWNGNNGIWKFKINSKRINSQLKRLLDQCKELKIKTIFYNKEDPINFNLFIETAKHFDIVVTTDLDSIEKYTKYKKKKVYSMPFTINPLELNNIGRTNDNNMGFFAGSYIYSLSALRKKNTEILCDKLRLKKNFVIFDRHYNLETIKNFYGDKFSLNIFPGRFNKYIHKAIEYNKILQIHKIYNWCGNLNTVSNSKTMFARRIIEASIMKNSIVSDYSLGVYENFSSSIYMLDGSNNLPNLINGQEILLNQIKKQKGWRNTILNFNTFNHFEKIFNQIGINNFFNPFGNYPKISVVCSTNRIDNFQMIIDNFSRQTYTNKELIIIFNIDICVQLENIIGQINTYANTNIIPIQIDSKYSLGYCLNYGIEISSGEIISKFDDDDYYGINYLLDMYFSLLISNADLVGKCANLVYSLENKEFWIRYYHVNYENYTYQANKMNFICGPTLFFKRKVYSKCRFRDLTNGEDTNFINDVKENNFTIYAGDFFNFCQIRTNVNLHTWKCDWKKFINKKKSIYIGKYDKLPIELIDN